MVITSFCRGDFDNGLSLNCEDERKQICFVNFNKMLMCFMNCMVTIKEGIVVKSSFMQKSDF